jgi:metal-sulfur cluster biosynthetic enzyme
MAKLSPEVVDVLRDVYDPCCAEKGISVVDMGLVRSAVVDPDGTARVELLLTSGWCPFSARVLSEVRQRVEALTGVAGADA